MEPAFDARVVPKPIRDDHGLIGDGVTGAHHVTTVDGIDYIAKNDGWGEDAASGSHVLLQEWICVRLAESLDVPVADYALLDRFGEPCFGSRKVPLRYSRFLPPFLALVTNARDIYRIAVFDAWVHNVDRHPGNLVIATQGEALTLMAIDHSHCPLFGAAPFAALQAQRDRTADKIIRPYLRELLTDHDQLAKSIERVQNLDDETIRSRVHPPAGIPCSDTEHRQLVDYLCFRRDALRDLFNSCRVHFPAIRERPL